MKLGKVAGNALKRSVLGQIHNKREQVVNGAGVGRDCAVLSFQEDGRTPGEKMTACLQEAAIADVKDASLLIGRCANNLAAAASEPAAALLGILLPQDTEEEWLKSLMKECEDACAALGMQLAGGHTEVSPAVNRPVVTVTALGRKRGSQRGAGPGMDLVASKWIGLEGTFYLAKNRKADLLNRYPSWLVEEALSFDRCQSVLPEAEVAFGAGVCAMHDVSQGGILGALWELAEGAGLGLSVDLKKIPIRQETVEICEYVGANPYELLSGGCLLMVTEDGPGLVRALNSAGIPGQMIGRTTDGHERLILNGEDVRYLDRPGMDELYRILR